MTFEDLDATQGSGFNVELSNSYIFAALIDVAQSVSRKGFAVSEAELEAVQIARASALKTVSAHFANMDKNVRVRRANLVKYSGTRFVSLGFDCMPRTLLTRWGFKPFAKLGEPSMPFDLAIHPASAIEHILEGDFAFYADDSLTLDPKKGYPVCDPLGVELNHEPGENDWAALRQRYEARAQNFREVIEGNRPTVFVHHTDAASQASSIEALFERVKSMRGRLPTMFVCIHTPEFGSDAELALPGAHVITQAYPFAGYLWHRPRHTFSLRGVNFEQTIIGRLSEILEQHSSGIETDYAVNPINNLEVRVD